jgi:transposase
VKHRLPADSVPVTVELGLKRHAEGILNYYPNKITSAAIESLNNILQGARRRARGYRNFDYFRAICYWMGGKKFTNPVNN